MLGHSCHVTLSQYMSIHLVSLKCKWWIALTIYISGCFFCISSRYVVLYFPEVLSRKQRFLCLNLSKLKNRFVDVDCMLWPHRLGCRAYKFINVFSRIVVRQCIYVSYPFSKVLCWIWKPPKNHWKNVNGTRLWYRKALFNAQNGGCCLC